MRRKISSIVAVVFVVFACLFAGACGNKYEKMEFKVYYAFSADAEQWYDGTEGISLNYNPNDVYDGGERTSLIFDKGYASIYIKIEVLNVKEKDIDLISVSPTSTQGLDFSSVMVSSNQVFEIGMNGNVNSMFKIYEAESGRNFEFSLVVSRELQSITANLDYKPATTLEGVLNLANLDNLTFEPRGLTNQTKVIYMVDSIGHYQGDLYCLDVDAESAASYVGVVDDVFLKIHNTNFYYTLKANVVRIKAVSAYHDGAVDAADEIHALFDVYLTESYVGSPSLQFVNDGGPNKDVVNEINIYENGDKYSRSTVLVRMAEDLRDSLYATEIDVYGGKAFFETAIYVKTQQGIYEKYNFDNQENNGDKLGINGLYITKKSRDVFEFSIVNRDVLINEILVRYEINGLNFYQNAIGTLASEFRIRKGVMPTCITINDVMDLSDGDEVGATIYETANSEYQGLVLKLAPNPNVNISSVLTLEFENDSLFITDSKGNEIKSGNEVLNNSTIFVKFKTGVSGEKILTIKTLSSPDYYNGETVAVGDREYITVTYKLNKIVTADRFEFVQNLDLGSDVVVDEMYVNAENGFIYPKVYYTGSSLEASTIKLMSNNENFKFLNGSTEFLLSDAHTFESGVMPSGQKYRIYKIQIAANFATTAGISIFVNDNLISIREELLARAVYLMSNDAQERLTLQPVERGVKQFTPAEVDNGYLNFALVKGEYVNFEVLDVYNDRTDTIAGIELEDDTTITGDEFNTGALTYSKRSNNSFEVYAKKAGYTHILKLIVLFHVEEYEVIVMKGKTIDVQVAVYDPISILDVDVTRNEIAYSNPYYTEAGSTTITLRALTSNYGMPVEKIVFYDASENVEINNISQIRVSNNISNAYMADVELTFLSKSGQAIDIISNGLLYLFDGIQSIDKSFLEGSITLKLKDSIDLNKIVLTITALKFGESFDVSTSVEVKIVEIDKAKGIVVSGKSLYVDENENIVPELTLSFMNVKEQDGRVEKSFNANIRFETLNVPENKLRFDDANSALTYILYRYETDANGQLVKDANGKAVALPIDNTFFGVSFNNGIVNISAIKKNGGGLFKLVLVTKDSYKLKYDPNSILIDESHFDTKCEITIRVEDGEIGSEFTIRSVEDLKSINNNLDKNFVLAANLGEEGEVDIAPIGVIGTDVSQFKGSLNGENIKMLVGGGSLSENYSINMKIRQSANDATHGDLYGLFAWLGEDAIIKNLHIKAEFESSFAGGNVGIVAGVNGGTINNVTVEIKSGDLSLSNGVNFGGLVGQNNKVINASRVLSNDKLNLVVESGEYNIGLFAGLNNPNATINGRYVGKESLDKFTFDAIVNLSVENTNTAGSTNLHIGTISGKNMGIVSGMLVGGQMAVSNEYLAVSPNGVVGGLVGLSTGAGNKVELSTALSLDVKSTSNNIEVGGIVGQADETIIDYVKYVSAITSFKNGAYDILGCVEGKSKVGGIVASSKNASIVNSSVESFVDTVYNEATFTYETFYSIQNGTTTAGLVANAEGTTINNSFVVANIKSTGSINLTSNGSESLTYFIGNVDGTVGQNKTNYSVVNAKINGENIDVGDYIDDTFVVDANTTIWTNIYVNNGGNYEKAESYVDGKIYVKFKADEWENFVVTKTGVLLSDWELEESYNVVRISGINFFFPYLNKVWDNGGVTKVEPLQIVKPLSITADINESYVSKIDSTYVKEFNYADYESLIAETVIVNYINGNTEENTRNIFSTRNPDGSYNDDGLLNIEKLPEYAQGGYDFEIYGKGHLYAYFNESKQIVFTGVSGSTPILIRIYSVFNPDIELYVAFYTQSLFTELTLSSSSIYQVDETGYKYEINTYTGQNNKIISLGTKNQISGVNYTSLFDVSGIGQYLKLEKTLDVDTKLAVDTSSIESITLKIRDDLSDSEKIEPDEYEVVTFELFILPEYFGSNEGLNHVNSRISLGEVALRVNLYNAAKSISIDGGYKEFTTNDDLNFNVALTTDYVNASKYGSTLEEQKNSTINETVSIDLTGDNGEIKNVSADSDYIIIRFEIVEGLSQVEELLRVNNLEKFVQLFNCKIISSLQITENDSKIIGYRYNVTLELKDYRNYRYIKENIKFNLFIYAYSNESEVNNESYPMEILIKPTALSTVRIENYKVETLKVNTDYTSIVTNDDVQTSIVEPGSLGNVMMIYMEPTYSNITKATIKTSSLFVPSLSKNVQLKFTQLVLDQRGATTVFSTLMGEFAENQDGDTLNLRLVSAINNEGLVYNGVICLYIQLEHFTGLEGSLSVELNAETGDGKVVKRTKDLITTYIPDVKISYDEEKSISEGKYLIQKGTSENLVKLKVRGYQFNSDPNISIDWDLTPEMVDGQIVYDVNGVVQYTGDYRYDYQLIDNGDGTKTYLENRKVIIKKVSGDSYFIGDYVSYFLSNGYKDVIYDKNDDSYSMIVSLNVSADIPTSFKLSASLSLTTKDGDLITRSTDPITFCSTDYILNSVAVAGLTSSNSKNIALEKTENVTLAFTTDNAVNDLSNVIYDELINYAQNKGDALTVLAKMFSFYRGGNLTFADFEMHPEFEVGFINNLITITGVQRFSSLVKLEIHYNYVQTNNGDYVVDFSKTGKVLEFTFTINIYAEEKETEVLIHSAEDIYNSSSGSWNLKEGEHYVLMNDITLENVVPITTAIGSFDGNNRVISIKSFKVDTNNSDYGLFATVGTYQVEDKQTETQITRQTILKNIIVNYGDFEGTLALNNDITTVNFGGLVARNNGGLIYNCDVMNLTLNDKVVSLIVSSSAKVTFGGLVGENNGIITNSRVGRESYTRVTASKDSERTSEVNAGGLSFEIFNKMQENEKTVNPFEIVAGGFVGVNGGTISTSYVANTNLINYSTNERTNITSGFVGNNSGTISYSYAKADEQTISSSQPYSKGYVVDNKGNGIVSGFAYNNTGTISNSYSNIELKTLSAYISGFVYNNSGKIVESYAATTMNSGSVDSFAEQPFVGVSNAGVLLSTGTIENSYYLMRSETDNPYTDGDKDYAKALNRENFQNSENLIGFAFVLTNSKLEREQGIWSYYTTDGKRRILPELMNANIVAHSYRFVVETPAGDKVLTNASSYGEGSENNPHTISSVDEFNNVFTSHLNSENEFVGFVRFINNINFNDDEKAIKTRTKFTLGSRLATTSVEGNGMSINGIYLDVEDAVVEEIGLFAKIENAYVKNLNLNFATPKTDEQFSTTTATYSGGLAGRINNSAIININLVGKNTTLTGSNFVGGVAGLVTGNSLIYGIETNLRVKTGVRNSALYYNERDYKDLGREDNYALYAKKLSYVGGVAGVLDLTSRAGIEYNVQFIDVRGDQMTPKTLDGQPEATILASYAGGVAGYASANTTSFKLRYFVGQNDMIHGSEVAGGIFGVSLGRIVASQVAAEENTQFDYDTAYGDYVLSLNNLDQDAKIQTSKVGNMSLLQGDKYVGGLIGVGIGSTVVASYSKASIYSGSTVGGLLGVSVASTISYSYAIPFVNFHSGLTYAGGLIGAAYEVDNISPERNKVISEYEALFKLKNTIVNNEPKPTNIQSTYSTIILDNEKLNEQNNVVFDYVVANFDADSIASNNNQNLIYVYAGTINYLNDVNSVVKNKTEESNDSSKLELHRLFMVEDPSQIVSFQEVFAGWAIIKHWTLNEQKYFPLLNDKLVDNYINIYDGDDFEMLENNPYGKFRIVDNITVTEEDSNWIVSGRFMGTLIGEKIGDSTRPVVTVILKPKTANETTGFFKETFNATLSNIEFKWQPIDLSVVENVTMVSTLTCKDTNSLISNIEVRGCVDPSISLEGYIIDSDKSIGGFGGIVGEMTNTNILDTVFSGKVRATIKGVVGDAVYVGGTAGFAQTNSTIKVDGKEEEVRERTAVINNTQVGVPLAGNSSITSFDLTIDQNNEKDVYIGGSVGKADIVAISNNKVGDLKYEGGEDYKYITIDVKANEFDQDRLAIGGITAWAKDGMISKCDALTKINLVGTTKQDESGEILVAGLVGYYSLGNPTSTSGISNCNASTNISTFKGSDKLEVKGPMAVVMSAGAGRLDLKATMKECLFIGEINTDKEEVSIPILYAGGAVGRIQSTEIVNLQEITSNVVIYAGSTYTTNLYVGGLIGSVNKAEISYSTSWGRIVPIAGDSSVEILAGGLIGLIAQQEGDRIDVLNSYTISSVLPDQVEGKGLTKLGTGALVGKIKDPKVVNFNKDSVFYSSDYSLCIDENYINSNPLGNNLSAETMFNNKDWQEKLRTENGSENSIWNQFVVYSPDDVRMPYQTSLNDDMMNYGIIQKVSGNKYDYIEGSAMRPEQINSDTTFDQDNYKYYLLKPNADGKTPTFTNALYGILICKDVTYENAFKVGTLSQIDPIVDYDIDGTYFGIISAVRKNSAISNMNIVINEPISSNGNVGIIAGINNGVIFNCSVQGTAIEISGSGNYGLISCSNKGIISNCYSTAEINKLVSANLGGITYANSGKLVSNYFTGYIENENSTAAGIVVQFNEGYVYNNYMAGVVTKIKEDGNAFNASGNISGENNFIDSYSDIEYNHKEYDGATQAEREAKEAEEHAKLMPISTAELMSNIKKDTGAELLKGKWRVSVDSSYGFINKDGVADPESFFGFNYNYPVYRINKLMGNIVNDIKNQLPTGTGITNENLDTLDERYQKIVNGVGAPNQEYLDAFKIPHLGVLTSIQNLLDKSRNYVVIYDMNGLNKAWKPIGTYGEVNNFANPDEYGFSGVFVTNEYYNLNLNKSKTISNLGEKGLFANIDQAYFSDIKFGGLSNLSSSGAFGTNILPTMEDNANVYVNNVMFVENSVITIDSSSTSGGLFGTVEGYLKITLFSNKTEDNTPAMIFEGGNYVGLIAGTLEDGKIELVSGDYFVNFNGCENTGGVVGSMKSKSLGAEIIGGDNTITIFTNVGSNEFNTMIGGVVAKTEYVDANNPTGKLTISNITVCFGGTLLQFNTSYYGGIVAQVNASTEVNDFIMTSEAGKVEFLTRGSNKHFGLLAGSQNADLKVTSFTMNSISEVNVTCNNDAGGETFEYETTTMGIGLLVGSLKNSSLTVDSQSINEISITSNAIPNLGSLIGYIEDDGTGSGVKINVPKPEVLIKLQGTTNVGGLVGHMKGNIYNDVTFADELLKDMDFAQIIIKGSDDDSMKYRNFGGIFGRFDGESSVQITNKNEIIIDEEKGVAYNVGGVIGMLAEGTKVANLVNEKDFKEDNTFSETIITNVNGTKEITRFINVGGVVGYAKNAEITNVTNNAIIKGYQNVGGIVGNLSGDLAKLENSSGVSEHNSVDEAGENDDVIWLSSNKKLHATKDSNENAGEVYGIINVGGAVGLADESKVLKVSTMANVYGNTNVGGLIGLADKLAQIDQNYVYKSEDEETVVKGVYYDLKITEVNNVTGETKITAKTITPTGVGGVVGTINNSSVTHNAINEVCVASTEETFGKNLGEIEAISTISNYMMDVKVGDSNSLDSVKNFFDLSKPANLANKLKFSDVKTGFGGFAGTIDTESMGKIADAATGEKAIAKNYIKDINIEAQLGINVGTYLGVYRYSGNNTEGTKNFMDVPMLLGTNNLVDGGYNVGGIVGYVDYVSGEMLNVLDNKNLKGYNSEIKLQSRLGAMYVGGLAGKTDANTIEAFNISSSEAEVNITISTNLSYYVGGLIGRAEVGKNYARIASIKGNLGDWNNDGPDGEAGTADDAPTMIAGTDAVVVSGNDERDNFGALIGMLKSAKRESGMEITVEGNHNKLFTINVIENSNYVEGSTVFNSLENENQIDLYAQAYYINMDSFNISGSKNADYHGDGKTNLFTNKASGWAKEYTIAKTIQRCITMDDIENKTDGVNPKWDSIATIYDASNIRLVDVNGDSIERTMYERTAGEPLIYASTYIAEPVPDPLNECLMTNKNWNTTYGTKKKKQELFAVLGYQKDAKQVLEGTREHTYDSLQEVGFIFETYEDEGEDNKVMFIKTINMTNDNKASSGSIFRMDGRADELPEGKFDPKKEAVKDFVVTVFFIIVSLITAGYGSIILGAAASVMSKVGAAIKFIWKTFKAMKVFTQIAIIAALFGVVVMGIDLNKSNSQDFYKQVEYQGTGFLSSTYSREIRYNEGVVQYSSDDYVIIGGMAYQPHSRQRPRDFYSEQYLLLRVKNNGDGTVSAHDSHVVVYINEDQYKGYTTTPYYFYNEETGDRSNDTIPCITEDSKIYAVYKKYAIHEGTFWINALAGTVEQIPTSEFFRPDASIRESLYTSTGANSYIYGKWNGSNYEFLTKDQTPEFSDNHVTSCDASKAIVSYPGKEMEVTESSTRVLDKKFKYDASNDTTGLVEGYDYMKNAYYAAAGSYGAFTKYATFKHLETGMPADYDQDDNAGTKYVMLVEKVIENGVHIRNVEHYYQITNADFKGYADESYTHKAEMETVPTGEGIMFEVHPYSFTNPYDSLITDSYDGNTYRLDDSEGVPHKVTYFLYVGGFQVQTIDGTPYAYTEISKQDYRSAVTLFYKPAGGTAEDVLEITRIKTKDVWYDGNDGWASEYQPCSYALISQYWDGGLHISGTKNFWGVTRTEEMWLATKDLYLDRECTEKNKVSNVFCRSTSETIKVSVEKKEGNYEEVAIFKLYMINKNFDLETNGVISRTYVSYNNDLENGENYTYNMYLSYQNGACEFYTRFRYFNSWRNTKTVSNFNEIWSKNGGGYYDLIVENGRPNGRKTVLVETVKVSMSGKCYRSTIDSDSGAYIQGGSITVK